MDYSSKSPSRSMSKGYPTRSPNREKPDEFSIALYAEDYAGVEDQDPALSGDFKHFFEAEAPMEIRFAFILNSHGPIHF